MAWALFNIVVFPGFLFLGAYGLLAEYVDRKLYARMQNRVGPPWYQPLADFLKLISKETIIPKDADKNMFRLLPVFALAAATTAVFYIPIWGTQSLFPFQGDIIVVLYLLTIPTLTFFLAGWNSTSLFSAIGSVRVLTQVFAYEVPLFMALLGPALLAGTWTVSEMAEFYRVHPWYVLVNLPGLAVALVATQGKLERVPFDIPDAETEIVAGTFTEYSGKLLALFRMTMDVEMIVIAALLAAVFIPFFAVESVFLGFLLFVVKTMFIIFLLSLFRAVMARIRIEQMVNFCWKYLAPAALLQIAIDLFLKGVIPV